MGFHVKHNTQIRSNKNGSEIQNLIKVQRNEFFCFGLLDKKELAKIEGTDILSFVYSDLIQSFDIKDTLMKKNN